MVQWGRDLGSKKEEIMINPVKMTFPSKIKSISVGLDHAFFVGDACYAVGDGKYGELGVKDSFLTTPKIVPIRARKAFAAVRRSFFINEEGELLGCGSNKVNQLGLGVDKPGPFFEITRILEEKWKVEDVKCGFEHTLIEGKRLFLFGSNKKGQCGATNTIIDIFTDFPVDQPIKQVLLSWSNTFVLTTEGDLYGCGSNVLNQLPNESGKFSASMNKQLDFKIEELLSGSDSFYARVDDSWYVWGWNEHFNLATGDQKDVLKPTENEALNGKNIYPVGAYLYVFN